MKLLRSHPREKARQTYYFPLFKPRTKRDPNSTDYDVGESFRGTNRRDEKVLKLEYACKKKKHGTNEKRIPYIFVHIHPHARYKFPPPSPPIIFNYSPFLVFLTIFFLFFFQISIPPYPSLSISHQPMVISSSNSGGAPKPNWP